MLLSIIFIITASNCLATPLIASGESSLAERLRALKPLASIASWLLKSIPPVVFTELAIEYSPVGYHLDLLNNL